MGMKIATLKAVLQATRSVSTANTSPSAVTMLGANTTQIRLFLIAVSVAFDVNISQ